MPITRISSAPIATGDAVIATDAINGFVAAYDADDIPDYGTADWIGVITYNETVDASARNFVLYGDANNLIEHIHLASASSDAAIIRFRFSGSNLDARLSESGVTSGEAVKYHDLRRMCFWIETSGSNKTLHIAALTSDGKIIRSSSASTTTSRSWGNLVATSGAEFRVGGGNPAGTDSRCIMESLVFARAAGGMSGVSTTDSTITRLLRDPTYINHITGLDQFFCPLGDYVDASGDKIARNAWATLSASNKLKCPHSGAVADITITGSPTIRCPYDSGSTWGWVAQQADNQPNTDDVGNGVTIYAGQWGSNLFQGRTRAWAGLQLRDTVTGEPLGPPIPLVEVMQYEDSGDGGTLKTIRNCSTAHTDTHLSVSVWVTPNAVWFYVSRHHAIASVGPNSAYEVAQFLKYDDNSDENGIVIPTLGGLGPEDRATSYFRAAEIDGKLWVATRENQSSSGRLLVMVLDPSDDSIAHQFVTRDASSATYQAVTPSGVIDLGGGYVAITGSTRHGGTTGYVGIFGVLVHTAGSGGFGDNSNWYAGFSGEPLDGTGANSLTLGAFDGEEDAVNLWEENHATAEADLDDVVSTTAIGRDGRVFMPVRYQLDNSDRDDAFVIEDVFLVSWERVGTLLSRTARVSSKDLFETVMSASEFAGLLSNHELAPCFASSSGRAVVMMFADPDGATMDNTNTIYSNAQWGTRIGYIGVPDIADPSSAVVLSGEAFDIDVSGGLSVRPKLVGLGDTVSGGRAWAEVMADANTGALSDGAVRLVGVDIASAVSGVLALAAGPQSGADAPWRFADMPDIFDPVTLPPTSSAGDTSRLAALDGTRTTRAAIAAALSIDTLSLTPRAAVRQEPLRRTANAADIEFWGAGDDNDVVNWWAYAHDAAGTLRLVASGTATLGTYTTTIDAPDPADPAAHSTVTRRAADTVTLTAAPALTVAEAEAGATGASGVADDTDGIARVRLAVLPPAVDLYLDVRPAAANGPTDCLGVVTPRVR